VSLVGVRDGNIHDCLNISGTMYEHSCIDIKSHSDEARLMVDDAMRDGPTGDG
jgi:hypothetical protein